MFCTSGCFSSRSIPTAAPTIAATFVPQKALWRFTDATALAVDQFGNAFVVESSSNSILKLSPNGDSLHDVRGSGDDHYQFNGPCSIDARLSNAIFIADRFNHRVEQYTKDLLYSGTLYTRESNDPNTRFGYPTAVAADDAGNIYVADGENKRVIEFRSDYSYLRTIGGYSQSMRPEAILSNPVGLAVDADEHLIVLDNGGTSLVEYDNLGNFIARAELGEPARSITSCEKELFALMEEGSIVRRFQTNSLQEDRSWSFMQDMVLLPAKKLDQSDTSPSESFLFRNKQYYLLTHRRLYLCIPLICGDSALR
ncbi:MAG TPA: NHL repeat-containing protein [Candidatus Kapabacteria bacterium]